MTIRIRLAILDKDTNYLNRIVTAFTGKYADKLEIYSFTDGEKAMETIAGGRIDVFIVSAEFEIDITVLPKRIGFAYLVDSVHIETHREQRTICKWQKVDLIYKEILSIFSENANFAIGLRSGGEAGTKIVAFLSAAGGVGSSTLAAAFAIRLAKRGQKVLYLNFEEFGMASLFFSGEGQFDFGDVIYAIKSQKSNLALKLESTVKQDVSGVHFYDSSKIALDIREMKDEDYRRLLEELTIAGYKYIVLDTDFSLNKGCLELLKTAHNWVFVSDGTETSNQKLQRAVQALTLLEQREDVAISSRIALMYNKFSSKTGQTVDSLSARVLGGVPKYEQATTSQILSKLQELDVFEKLV